MKYRFIARYGSGFEVRKMSEVLGVNRSGYYVYRSRVIDIPVELPNSDANEVALAKAALTGITLNPMEGTD